VLSYGTNRSTNLVKSRAYIAVHTDNQVQSVTGQVGYAQMHSFATGPRVCARSVLFLIIILPKCTWERRFGREKKNTTVQGAVCIKATIKQDPIGFYD